MTSVVDASADGVSRTPSGEPIDVATRTVADPALEPATPASNGSAEPGPRRRRPVIVGGVIVVGVLILATAVFVGRASSGGVDGGAAAADETTRQTTQVSVRDLIEQESLSGTLGFGETRQLSLPAPSDGGNDNPTGPSADDSSTDTGSGSNIVTGLPAVGTVVERGQTIAEVDGAPVPLLYTDRPFWRSLSLGVSDGADVKMLEENLVALGHATTKNLTVDEKFTEATAAAIKRWQDALDRDETGIFDPADAAVQPGPVRVAKQVASLGSSASGVLLEVTGASKYVTLDLAADRQDLISVGLAVEVVLPDGQRVPGTIESIGTVATAESNGMGGTGDPTVPVTIVFADPAAVGGFDQAPVTVNITTEAATGVLAVPVDALLALAEGGYAVERIGAGGVSELVGVELGAFADGWVEVRGPVADGDEVVVPG